MRTERPASERRAATGGHGAAMGTVLLAGFAGQENRPRGWLIRG